jgi:hypothetical protein
MVTKKVLNRDRIRRIDGGFSFIPHRFLTAGFLASLNPKELVIYFFLILVSDRNGLSFYGYDSICSLLHLTLEEYIAGRDALIEKDLIAFDGTCFQVLSLPDKPIVHISRLLDSPEAREEHDPATVRQLIQQSLEEGNNG